MPPFTVESDSDVILASFRTTMDTLDIIFVEERPTAAPSKSGGPSSRPTLSPISSTMALALHAPSDPVFGIASDFVKEVASRNDAGD